LFLLCTFFLKRTEINFLMVLETRSQKMKVLRSQVPPGGFEGKYTLLLTPSFWSLQHGDVSFQSLPLSSPNASWTPIMWSIMPGANIDKSKKYVSWSRFYILLQAGARYITFETLYKTKMHVLFKNS
jgi:hypothetical protein